MSRIGRIVLAAALLWPTAVAAQRCMGGASFADRRAHIGTNASFSRGARSIIGAFSISSPYGPFASLGFGTAHTDDLKNDAKVFAATAGMGLPLRPRATTTQFCPFLSAVVVNDVEFPTGARLSSEAFALGASVGKALSVDSTFEVVPFAGAAVVTHTTTIELRNGATGAENDHYYAVSLGAGLVFAKVITIAPFTTLTVAERRTSASYGVQFSFSFGRAARRPRTSDGEGSLTTVWVNTRTGVYYCPGAGSYGATPYGSFMSERDALAIDATPVVGRRC